MPARLVPPALAFGLAFGGALAHAGPVGADAAPARATPAGADALWDDMLAAVHRGVEPFIGRHLTSPQPGTAVSDREFVLALQQSRAPRGPARLEDLLQVAPAAPATVAAVTRTSRDAVRPLPAERVAQQGDARTTARPREAVQ